MDNVIEMNHITKRFGQFFANDDITLHVKKGENPRLARRKRCRQINFDECFVWHLSTRWRRNFDQQPKSGDQQSQ